MLNSGEHEIDNAHKYKNIKTFRILFFLFINVKMPTIVGILTFRAQGKHSCSAELNMKMYFITSGPGLTYVA